MKQKNYKILISIVAISLLMSACQKFLDVKRSNQEFYIETADDCQKILDNYGSTGTQGMSNACPTDGEASSDSYYVNLARFNLLDQENKDIYTFDSQAQRISAGLQWSWPYRAVYYTNLVLDNLDKIKNKTDQTTLNNLKGSALFFRASYFWTVAQIYAGPYIPGGPNNSPGIPLRLSSDMNYVAGRGTVQQTYDKIIQDLKEAADLLPEVVSPVSRPSKSAAYAMLARTYLSMEDYPNALINANTALTAGAALNRKLMDYNSISTTSNTPFLRFNDEVYFHVVTAADFQTSLLNPGSATGPSARINDELYASYNSNDLRKAIFFKANTVSVMLQDADDATKTKKVSLQDGTYRFTGNYEATAFNAILFAGLAVDEIMLVKAECLARANNVGAAMDVLNALLVTRWKKVGGISTYVNMTATTVDEALSKILEERRKELVMRGQRWTDLRRLNRDTRFKKDITHQVRSVSFSGTNLAPVRTETIDATYTLPANDMRYTLLIPQEVINVTKMEQNKR